MNELHALPGTFPVSASEVSPDIQPFQKHEGAQAGADQQVDVGDRGWSGFAQESDSYAPSTSIEIDDDDDEPSTSDALSSKCGQTDLKRAAFSPEYADDDVYQFVKSHDSMNVDDPSPHNDTLDLGQSIKGMYRILDLISEQGSGGLVDKVIIAQDSLRAFINSICPGTYVSMTKVNFSALDRFIVKPVGVYGSKGEIVRLLSSLGVVDQHIAAQLIMDQSDSSVSMPSLHSGLYIVRTACEATPDQQLFLIYWPEDRTWDDSAPSSTRRNSVTFMRYLMKMCDQVIALISPEHARSIAWNEQEDAIVGLNKMQDESNRMFTFEVAKTHEQEEAVKLRPGFKAMSKDIAMPLPHLDPTVVIESLKPSLLHGETAQGFMTVAFRPGRHNAEAMKNRSMTRIQLSHCLESDALRISEDLSADALEILIDAGIQDRFQEQCEQLRQEIAAISCNMKATTKSEETRVQENLEKDVPLLRTIFQKTFVDAIIQNFPTFTHGLEHEQDSLAARDPVSAATFFPTDDSFPDPTGSEQDNKPDQSIPNVLNTLIALYPEIGQELHRKVQRLQLIDKINTRSFRTCKERICIAQYFLRNHPEVGENFINVILHEDMGRVKEALKTISKGTAPLEKHKGIIGAILGTVSSFVLPGLDTHSFEAMLKDDVDANSVSDSQFLVELADIKTPRIMATIVQETRAAAQEYFGSLLTKWTAALTKYALFIQIEQCLHQVQREALSREDE